MSVPVRTCLIRPGAAGALIALIMFALSLNPLLASYNSQKHLETPPPLPFPFKRIRQILRLLLP